MIYLILGLVIGAGILLKIALSQAKTVGKVEVANSTQKEAIDNAKEDAVIRDRLEHDAAERKRVQQRFQRD